MIEVKLTYLPSVLPGEPLGDRGGAAAAGTVTVAPALPASGADERPVLAPSLPPPLGTLPPEEAETGCALAPPTGLGPPSLDPCPDCSLALGWVPPVHVVSVACGPGALSPGLLSGPGGLMPALEIQVRFLGQ